MSDWPAAPRLPGPPDPEPLPLGALPPVLARQVRSVSATTQTPSCMAAALSLAAVSIALRGIVVVAPRSGWRELATLYVTVVAPPGTRKSAVFDAMFSPLNRWEAAEAARLAEQTARELTEHATREAALKGLIRAAAQGKADPDEVENARIRLAEHKVIRARRLVASDVTPEAIPQLLLDNGGAIGISAPEGDPLRITAGRYSRDGAANMDVLKRGWSGESLPIDRVGRPPQYVRRPSLTLALCLQPSVLETIGNAKSLRGEGLFGRICWVQPTDTVGLRKTGYAVPAADDAADLEYGRLLCDLLKLEPWATESDGTVRPHILNVSPEALATLYGYEAQLETRMGEGGDLFDLRDWAAKSHGQVARIAGLLHVVQWLDDAWQLAIDRETMAAAVEIVLALTAHAQAVLGKALDERMADVEYVLRRIRALPAGSTVRDVYRAVDSPPSIAEADSPTDYLAELLDILVQLGCVRLRPQPSTGGRPPSPVVELHPKLQAAVRTPVIAEVVL